MPLDAESIDHLYRRGVGFVLVAAAITLPALLFITAPYGRYTREGYGFALPARLAWVVMELPAPLVFALVYLRGPHAGGTVPLVFLGLWQLHYLQEHRGFRLRSGSRSGSGRYVNSRRGPRGGLRGLARGAATKVDLGDGWNFWDYVELPIDVAREKLGIPPLNPAATDA